MVDNPTQASVASSVESKEEAFKDPASTWRFYMDAIDVCDEQEADWRKDADLATKIYRCDKDAKRAFNILHSNVQVKVPAIYNSKPEPDVRPRDRSKKDQAAYEAGRLGAQCIDLALRYQMDEYDFDAVARSVVRDSQIAGRGVARVQWKTYLHQDQETGEQVVWEEASCKRIPWRFFRRGPGVSWEDVRWVSYEHALTKDQIIDLAGQEIADEVSYDITDVSEKLKDGRVRELSVWQRAMIHEVWDKDAREVLFISPGYSKGPLKREPDPYGLLEFFDCEVLQSLSDTESLNPICPYMVYKEQAEELATISQRILILTTMLKFRGIRAAEISEFDKLEDLEDGEFMVSNGALALVGGSKGLADAIWVMPLAELAGTIQQLILQRDQIKQVIYELTGISDIMRGASNPNETLGAQQIKAQSGSLRAHDEIAEAESWCRNVLRKKAEIIANKFSKETLAAIVGEELAPAVEQVLRSDVRRRYLVDVETNSTIRGDLARNQENMAGFMQSMGQFIQTFVPLMQPGPNGAPFFPPQMGLAAVTIVSAFAKQFKLGKVVDDTLANLEESAKQWMEQQQQPDPQKKQQQQEQQALQKRIAEASAVTAEAAARKTSAEAAKVGAETEHLGFETEHTKAKIDALKHTTTMGVASGLVGVQKSKVEADKTAEEVTAQGVETAQQELELQHKSQRGPYAPDPTEVARARINADASVATGKHKADASVEAAKQKKPPPDGGFSGGFVA